MRRCLRAAVALTLIAAACGGGETDAEDGGTSATDTGTTASTAPANDTTTATTQAPTTTVGAGVTTGNFCDDAENSDQLIDGFDFFTTDVEAAVTQWVAAINEIEAQAPAEIAADVGVIANAAREFAALLAEADYQIVNIDPEDDRMAAFDDGSIDQAAENIAAWCGWELEALDGGDDGGDDGLVVVGNDPIPEDLPEALVPPEVAGADDNGAAGLNIASSASIDEVLEYYEDLLGAPLSTDGDTVTFNGTVEGKTAVVIVQPITGGLVLVTLIVF